MYSRDECWALRRGQAYVAGRDQPALVKHVPERAPTTTMCLPLLGHGDFIGVFHLASPREVDGDLRRRPTRFCEQLSLTLANLQLREMLRVQSIRNPLTGLLNRRYTEETLERELRRSMRTQESLGVLMIDVDHFKKFNDTFGHEAGNLVLRELAGVLKARTRASDVASRMGGEEMVVILPGPDLEASRIKAEILREGVSHLKLKHLGNLLGPVTISVGVASFPEHGQANDELFRAADTALYCAKHDGRNCVRTAEPEPPPSIPAPRPMPSA